MADDRRKHTVFMEEREGLALGGVTDVLSFDEEAVVCATELGVLTIQGKELHVKRLSLETGELSLEGEIDALSYSDGAFHGTKGGLWSKLFK